MGVSPGWQGGAPSPTAPQGAFAGAVASLWAPEPRCSPAPVTAGALRPHHALLPDHRHALLDAVGALGDEGEVVLANSLLGSGEGAVGTASHLEVPARASWAQWSPEGPALLRPAEAQPALPPTLASTAHGLEMCERGRWAGAALSAGDQDRARTGQCGGSRWEVLAKLLCQGGLRCQQAEAMVGMEHASCPGPARAAPYLDSREVRWSAVVGSGLTGGDVTKAAALAQFLSQ